MGGPTWFDHFIDFWVIFFADIGAAYVALRWFEARKEDRKRALESLNEIYKVCSSLSKRYKAMKEGFKNSGDSAATNLPRDITDDDRQFYAIESDFLFWSFNGGPAYHRSYKKINELKGGLSARTVGEARTKLTELIGALDRLSFMATVELKPKSIRSWIRGKLDECSRKFRAEKRQSEENSPRSVS